MTLFQRLVRANRLIPGRYACVHREIPPCRLELVFSFEFVGHCQVSLLHRIFSRRGTVGRAVVDGPHVRVLSRSKCVGDGSVSVIRHVSECSWKTVAQVERLQRKQYSTDHHQSQVPSQAPEYHWLPPDLFRIPEEPCPRGCGRAPPPWSRSSVVIAAKDLLRAAPLQRIEHEACSSSPFVPAALFSRYTRAIFLSLTGIQDFPRCVGRGATVDQFRSASIFFLKNPYSIRSVSWSPFFCSVMFS